MRKSLTKVKIKQIFREAAAIKDSGFKLLYKKNSTDLSRMAVTTPRNYGNAVERNRTKRIIREVFRRIKEQLKEGGYNLLFVVYKKNMVLYKGDSGNQSAKRAVRPGDSDWQPCQGIRKTSCPCLQKSYDSEDG